MILFRPTGVAELGLVANSGWKKWPPRLPDQPIFYPVTTFDYAEKIARDWNAVGSEPEAYGFAAQFEISDVLAAKYPVEIAGGKAHSELWVPAEELNAFDDGILGEIAPLAAYKNKKKYPLGDAMSKVGLNA